MKKLVSFVLPVYNEEETINEFYGELIKTVNKIIETYEVELIFVNDGSNDTSLHKLTDIYDSDHRVSLINFSRNFGHQIGITAGLDHTKGDAVIIMDTDLQDPPAVCLDLIEKWEQGFDVVYAKRKTRQDSFLKILTADLFYRLLSKIANIKVPSNVGDFRLLDKKVVAELNKFRETNRFMRGLVSFVGFNQTSVLFDRQKRFAGKTKYPINKMIKFAADGITSFSTAPLTFVTNFGFFVSIVSFLGIAYTLIVRIFFPDNAVSGWAFLAISILFMGGVQILMLGLVGNYIGRIYSEVQRRPLYVIDTEFRHGK